MFRQYCKMSFWRSSKISNALNVSRERLKKAAKNGLKQATSEKTAESSKTDVETENAESREGLNATTAASMKAAFTRIKYATESKLGTAKATGAGLKAGINTMSERVSSWDAKTKTMVGAGLVAGAIAAVPLAGIAAASAFATPVIVAAPSALASSTIVGGISASASSALAATPYVITTALSALSSASTVAGSALATAQGLVTAGGGTTLASAATSYALAASSAAVTSAGSVLSSLAASAAVAAGNALSSAGVAAAGSALSSAGVGGALSATGLAAAGSVISSAGVAAAGSASSATGLAAAGGVFSSAGLSAGSVFTAAQYVPAEVILEILKSEIVEAHGIGAYEIAEAIRQGVAAAGSAFSATGVAVAEGALSVAGLSAKSVFTAAQYVPAETILESVKAAAHATGPYKTAEAIRQYLTAAEIDPSSWLVSSESGSMPVAVKLVIGGTVAVTVVIVALPLLGFTPGGVAAGSAAAFVQSCIGNVAAGSTFALLQSAGVLGLAPSTLAAIGTVGGIVAVEVL